MSTASSSPPITETAQGVRITVHAQPGAKRTELSGLHGDAIKVRIHAPPLDGRANDELIRFLANLLKVSRSQVSLVRGEKSRAKVFDVAGVDESAARAALLG